MLNGILPAENSYYLHRILRKSKAPKPNTQNLLQPKPSRFSSEMEIPDKTHTLTHTCSRWRCSRGCCGLFVEFINCGSPECVWENEISQRFHLEEGCSPQWCALLLVCAFWLQVEGFVANHQI